MSKQAKTAKKKKKTVAERRSRSVSRRSNPPSVQELTREQMWQILDERSKALLGMSGEEFVRRAKEGSLPLDDAAVTHLKLIAGVR